MRDELKNFFFLLFWMQALSVKGQPLSLHFQKIQTQEGISLSNSTAATEDRYGYMWIGTVNGIYRYDGYGVKAYEHRSGDPGSPIPSPVRYAFCDSQGRLWFSFLNGLMEYDYARDAFKSYYQSEPIWMTHIVEGSPQTLYVGTSNGLMRLNTSTGEMFFFDSLGHAQKGWESQVACIQKYGKKLYLITLNDLVVFDLETEQHRAIPLPQTIRGARFSNIAINEAGELWVAGGKEGQPVYRTDTALTTWKAYQDFVHTPAGQPNRVVNLLFDHRGRLWASTTQSGIALYNPATDRFRFSRIEPWMPNGLPGVYLGELYQDRRGMIWGATFKGHVYFDPDNTFFQTLLPDNNPAAPTTQLQSADMAERPDGKQWLATREGLYLYDPVTDQTLRRYVNQPGQPPVLYNNSIRSVCLDKSGNLWVATVSGLNRMRPGQEQFDFLDEKDGIPTGTNYMCVRQTRGGTIWLADFSDTGHHYLLPGETRFRAIKDHPVLAPYADCYGHSIFEDSRRRLWFGLDGLGLVFYDSAQQQARHWRRTPENDTTLVGNFVNSITETPDGTIWAATHVGLSAIDPNTFRFRSYDRARGLPTNRIACVLGDRYNRIWAGTSIGLLLLDSTGRFLRLLDQHDGLIENDFTVFPAFQMRDGRFSFPSKRGFVQFNPDDYRTQTPFFPLMLSGIRVLNRPFVPSGNPESLSELYLPPDKNFFSLEMLALRYDNPRQTWYAYKMEPYNQDWTYTRDRMAHYTNVPSGRYLFRYKASADPNDWNVPEKTLYIRVGQHWYLSGWLWWPIALTAAALLFLFYRRRERLQAAFLSLERKAQALAKEKALVQYENLTQQLNPHFLFNSLASLGSLIRFDPGTASEFLEALSKMYRYILQSRERETVPLDEELTFAEHFLKLQQTRFGTALQVRFDVPAACRERKIVPVTLQNLLENALKHNTLDADDPLTVDISVENDHLVVRNNLQRRPIVETSNKQGLTRLQSLYQYLSDVPMEAGEDEGYFVVKIPLL